MKGDIVVRMGDHEVNDMMGYMEGLMMFEKARSPCGDCAEWREPGPRRHGTEYLWPQGVPPRWPRAGEESPDSIGYRTP